MPADLAEGADDVGRPFGMDLQKLAVVDDHPHDVPHVVATVRLDRHQVKQLLTAAVDRVLGMKHRCGLVRRRWKQLQQIPNVFEAGAFILVHEACHP